MVPRSQGIIKDFVLIRGGEESTVIPSCVGDLLSAFGGVTPLTGEIKPRRNSGDEDSGFSQSGHILIPQNDVVKPDILFLKRSLLFHFIIR